MGDINEGAEPVERRRRGQDDRLLALGQWIQNRRKVLGSTQEDAAERAGVSADQWGLWERARAQPRAENIDNIAKALQTSPDVVKGKIAAALLGEGMQVDENPVVTFLDGLATKEDLRRVEQRLDRILDLLGRGQPE